MTHDTKRWTLTAPITRWDEAIPLGSGLTGALLWGDGKEIRLSLDRSDLWDERTNGVTEHPDWTRQALMEIAAAGDVQRLAHLDELAQSIIATKLPIGSVALSFDRPLQLETFQLDMEQATGWASDIFQEKCVECFCAAGPNALWVRLSPEAAANAHWRILPPEYTVNHTLTDQPFVNSPTILGYQAGQMFAGEYGQGYVQPCGDTGLHFAIFLGPTATPRVWRITVEKALSAEAMAEKIQVFKSHGFKDFTWESAWASHLQWWREFWEHSALFLPESEKELERYYHLCRYFYGSAARRGAPPMALQAIWTAADGTLPPWKGDFHHDLNTQMSYIAYLTSGDWDCGAGFFDHLSGQLAKYRKFAQTFYGVSGVAVPGTATLAGQSLGGWPQFSMTPTNSAWLATMFTTHYRYTCNRQFLEEQAWPFVSGVGELMVNLLRLGPDGKYQLPLSTSPEIHDNALAAFLPEFSNYDLALTRQLFMDLVYLCRERGDDVRAEEWQKQADRLPPLAIDPEKGLMLCPGENLMESHRHHSHLMAIYPLCQLRWPQDAPCIEASLQHLDALGMGQWIGFSFGWSGALSAVCGMGDRALRMLRIFLDGFISRNGFHVNGDFKKYGYSMFKYRPFTLESNFLAQQVLHEMLLQTRHGQIRLFPALPSDWQDVSLHNWRGEGGLRISATLKQGQLQNLRITAEFATTIHLVNPGYGAERLTGGSHRFSADEPIWQARLEAGETLRLLPA